MLLAEVVEASGRVAATPARGAKIAALADLLRRLGPDEVEPAVGFLVGEPRQGRIGVGWATLTRQPSARGGAGGPEAERLTIKELDRALTELAGTTGSGSVGARGARLESLLGRMTREEIAFLSDLLTGGLRQGALEGVMAEAVARAAEVPATLVRRACMLAGDVGRAAAVALADGRAGLEAIGLEVLRPVQPMLASTAADVASAVADLGLASVEWKLDGIRLQIHRRDDAVRIFTRNLNDITDRMPEVAEVVRGLPADRLVLDGEALGDTAHLFDCLHLDGDDLLERPLLERLAALERVAGAWRIPGEVTDDPATGEKVLRAALAAGHEGAVVKGARSTYEAGRRGKSWRKVKVARTFDLVVLGAEWGHGRRTGWLSNLHLGARDPLTGEFVMVGKTFKGMTQKTLEWQTHRFLELETHREGITVFVRPEVVAEIALDGVQVSTRYPGGVTLRFARLKRYREDKAPADADTIDCLRAFLNRDDEGEEGQARPGNVTPTSNSGEESLGARDDE